MGTPPLNKNGHDHAQDRDIRELRDQFRSVRLGNEDDHKAIGEKLDKVVSFHLVLKVLGLIGLALIASIVGLTISNQMRLNQVEQKGSIEGATIDAALRRDVDRNGRDINILEQIHRGQKE